MEPSQQTIFVGGFSPFLKESNLKNYFDRFGAIKKIILKKDVKKKINKGYAFIICENQDTINRILNAYHEIEGRVVDCDVSHCGTKKNDDIDRSILNRVCIKGLHRDITNKELHVYFSKYGTVKKAFIIYDPITKRSKLFGYVEYNDQKEKMKALNQKSHILKGKEFVCEQYIPRCFIEKVKNKNEESGNGEANNNKAEENQPKNIAEFSENSTKSKDVKLQVNQKDLVDQREQQILYQDYYQQSVDYQQEVGYQHEVDYYGMKGYNKYNDYYGYNNYYNEDYHQSTKNHQYYNKNKYPQQHCLNNPPIQSSKGFEYADLDHNYYYNYAQDTYQRSDSDYSETNHYSITNHPSYYQQQPISYQQKPIPYQQKPIPYQQKPIPYQQQPIPYQQQPIPYQQQPIPYQQQPIPYQQQPIPYQQQLIPYQQQHAQPNSNFYEEIKETNVSDVKYNYEHFPNNNQKHLESQQNQNELNPPPALANKNRTSIRLVEPIANLEVIL